MTKNASPGNFQTENFPKKKKKKHKEHKKKHESGEEESMPKAEIRSASPLLFEDQAARDGEGCKNKKKKKKREKEKEKEQASLDNYCVALEHTSSNETEAAVSRKEKKKKKRRYDDSTDEQSGVTCVKVNQSTTGSCQEMDADYIYVQNTVKKKRKTKLPEEEEVRELSASETADKNSSKGRKKKKKKRHRSTPEDPDVTIDQLPLSSPAQDPDVTIDQLPLSSPAQDPDVTIDQSPLSSPAQNREWGHKVLPLPAEREVVAAPQQRHEDSDGNVSPAESEKSADVPVDFSKPTTAAHQSKKTPGRVRKKIKSSAFVKEESSSESDVPIPKPSSSDEGKDQNRSLTEVAACSELSPDEEECLDYSVCSIVDLDTAKQELEEFIPHVRSISDSTVRKMAGRDLMRFKQFKKQGVAVKFGRFSEKENNQIRKNIEEFLSITGIDSAEKLLFTSRYPEDKETISRLKAENLFCEKLSEGIPRPWRLIYYRARKIFDPNNYKGKYTKEEKEKLKKYHAMHGNDWKKISEMMSRSNLSVAMKYSEIKSAINYGPWSKEETQKLMHAVEEVIRKRIETEDANRRSSSGKSNRDLSIAREKLFQKLPWTEIEAKVGTRYWRQCKQKWTTILTNRMTKGQQLYRGTKGLQAKINLIKRLHEMKVDDANDVNWEELSNAIGDVPKAYVQAKFYKLKVSCVPSWQKKTFSEIIDYLFEEKLPELEEKLEKKKGKPLNSDNSAAMQQKKTFRLSDIFYSSEDSD